MRIVVSDSSTCVDLASFNPLTQGWGDIMPIVVTFCIFLAIVIMSHKNVKGSVFIGIIGGMGLYYLLGLAVDGFYSQLGIQFVSPFTAFGLLSYIVISVFCGDLKKIKISS